MHCPLRTFWRRQARGQEVPSAATARTVVQQMVGRYARQRPINGARACLGAPSSRIRRQRNGSGMCECSSQGRRRVHGPSRGVTLIVQRRSRWTMQATKAPTSTIRKIHPSPNGIEASSSGMPLSRMPKPTTGRARASIWALSRSFSSTRRRSSAVFSSSVRLSSTPTRGQISDHTHGDDLFAARCLLALGLVTLYLLRRLPRVDEVSRHWRAAFAWAAGTALAGV
jgi:hypothetical protein